MPSGMANRRANASWDVVDPQLRQRLRGVNDALVNVDTVHGAHQAFAHTVAGEAPRRLAPIDEHRPLIDDKLRHRVERFPTGPGFGELCGRKAGVLGVGILEPRHPRNPLRRGRDLGARRGDDRGRLPAVAWEPKCHGCLGQCWYRGHAPLPLEAR
jgi:hypothetical protein